MPKTQKTEHHIPINCINNTEVDITGTVNMQMYMGTIITVEG
jgi:hypothetical protein